MNLEKRIAQLSPAQRKDLETRLKKQNIDILKLPISKVNRGIDGQGFSLSFEQERLWFIQQLEPGNTAYNIIRVTKFTGRLYKWALEQAVNALVKRHEILRTIFITGSEGPLQVILNHLPVSLEITALTNLTGELQKEELNRVIDSEARYVFDLTTGPLCRTKLLVLNANEDEHIFILTVHHIISDGISIQVMVEELGKLYRGFLQGQDPGLIELPIQYVDYANWQRFWFGETGKTIEFIKKQEIYWLKQFEGELPVLTLPVDYERPGSWSFEGKTALFYLTGEETAALKEMAKKWKTTLYVVLLSIYTIFLARLSGMEDIIVGTPVAGRRHPGLRSLIGMFVNTLAFRNFPVHEQRFCEFLEVVKNRVVEAFENQEYPYESLFGKLEINRDISRNPLFNVMFLVRNIISARLDIEELNWKLYEYEDKIAQLDVTLTAEEVNLDGIETLRCDWQYAAKLFKEETIRRFSNYFKEIVREILDDYQIRLANIEIIPTAEREKILSEFNTAPVQYPGDKTIDQLFAEQVARIPGQIALTGAALCVCPGIPMQLSYLELNRQAGRLELFLKEKGVRADDIVAIKIERSIDQVIALLGILKSNSAYLPIDPGFPQERIDYMLKDSNAKILINKSEARISKYETNPNVQKINDQNKNIKDLMVLNFENLNFDIVSNFGFLISNLSTFNARPRSGLQHSNHLAYIIYTSGSTGSPKGVMVEHRNVVRLVKNPCFIKAKEGQRLLMTGMLTFDIVTFEIWWPLLNGLSLYQVDKSTLLDPVKMEKIICLNRIDILHLVPQLFNQLYTYNPGIFAGLSYFLIGGDLVQPGMLRQLRDKYEKLKILHMYGPTENTTFSTYLEVKRLEAHDRSIPIGTPVNNTSIYILGNHNELLPIKIIGQLCTAGDGVTRGYLNNPELTAENFILPSATRNPFEKGFPDFPKLLSNHSPIYKTGDLARWLEDGNIEFIGRIDHQVKLRGFRVELGEVESRLLKYKLVKEAVVIDRINTDGNLYLCAYLVLHPAQIAQSTQMPQIPPGTTRLDTRELHEFLARQLPDYMIPSYFIEIKKIPLNANGKIDRRALTKREITSLNDQTEYIPPGNTIEKTLAETWEKVLGRPHIGINENFFMIGGDSIKSIQVIARMNSAGYRMEMKDLFQYPTIANLAPRVKKLKRFPGQSVVTGTIPLTPIQAMFFEQCRLHPHHFIQSVMLNAKERLDSNIVKNIFAKIQEHHDALRMTYDINSENGTVIQMDHGLPYPLSLDEYEINDASPVLESLVEKIQASIDLEKGPLMRLGLFHFTNGDNDKLLIVIHHLVIDGISWRILFEDIDSLYKLYKQGEKLILPLKTDSFKLWAERLSLYAGSKAFLKEKAYWQQVELLTAPLLTKDFDIADNNVKDSGHISFNLDEKGTVQLLTKVNEVFKTEINDILLTALAKSIDVTFGINPILIALEGHGRESILEDIDISRTVGWFTTVYPVWLEVSNAGDNYRVKKIKEALRQVPNKGIGYGILKYLTGEDFKKETKFKLQPQIRFNYLGQFDADVKQLSFFEIAESTGSSHGLNNEREYLLDVSGIIINNRLEMTISFNKTHFKPGTMSMLANNLENELKSIIAYCCSRKKIEYTPSDFNCRGLSIESVDMVMELFPGVEDLYALTPMQEGMLFHALANESSYSYFEQMSYRLHGELDIIAVEKSLNELFKRHDILRTSFVHKNIEHPVQVVLKERVIDFYYQDITKEENKNIFIKEFKEKDRQQSFDLCRDGLMRVAILQPGEMEYEFIWSSHHIIIDGWCFGILNNEFFEIYTSIINNRPYRLPAVKPYRTYIQWLEKQDKEESARYWRNYLDSYEEKTAIPRTNPTSKKQEYNNQIVMVELDMEKAASLNKLAAANQVTLNILTQALWGIILGKFTGQEDVVFGSVVSGRPADLDGVESMMGLFINTIPVRIRFAGKMKFCQLIQQVQQEALAGIPYHYHPLAEIQAQTALKQDLIDHILVFENYPIAERINKNNEISLEIINIDVFLQTNYDFNIILDIGRHFIIRFEYNGNVFAHDYIEQIAQCLLRSFDQVSTNEAFEICDLSLLSDKEKSRLLYDFNNTGTDYPKDKTINQLFTEQVEEAPDHISLVGAGGGEEKKRRREEEKNEEEPFGRINAFGGVHISYRELNEQSNRLAELLIEKGIMPDNIAGIKMTRSVELITGILGILKSGGAYLPIEPDEPPERVIYMLKDTRAKIIIDYDFLKNEPQAPLHHHSSFINHHSNLSYIIYTSGSTGSPKGVMVEHRNVVRLVKNTNYVSFAKSGRMLQSGAVAFDASTFEIWGALLNGLTLYITPKEEILDPMLLKKIIRRYDITLMWMTSSLFNHMLQEDIGIFASLKTLLAGGDVLSPENTGRLKNTYPHLEIINGYGPTENTTFSTTYSIGRTYLENIPIGKPIANSTAYIVDKYNHLQPVGVPGELMVGGEGVARGYLNNPELTAENFILPSATRNPFEKGFLDFPKLLSNHSPIYKTGDMARWLPDGNIEFIGRLDQQIKIRGFRIELGEIENRLVKYPGIKEAVVSVLKEEKGDKYLCAYIADGSDNILSKLREYLGQELPGYMIPSYFVRIEKIPLTPNGKIDRKALPRPEIQAGNKYTAPRNEIEKKLALLWAEILSKDALHKSKLQTAIGIDDHFFQLGGHSLKATILVSRIHKEFAVKIPLTVIFKNPLLKELAAYIKDASLKEYKQIELVEKKEYYVLSSAQKRLYFLQEMDKGTAYNIPSFLIMEGHIDKNNVAQTIKKIVRRHESLRTSINLINTEPVQQIHDQIDKSFAELFQKRLPEGGQPAEALNTFIRPFDLSKAPLLRIELIRLAEEKHLFMVDMHHIISDGMSAQILVQEFSYLYAGQELPEIKVQYKDYAEWQNREKANKKLLEQGEYWKKQYEGEIPVLELPTGYVRPAVQDFAGNSMNFEIDTDASNALKMLALETGSTLYIVLLTLYAIFLTKLSSKEDVVIGSPVFGRRHADLEKIIGMFVNTLALRLYPLGEKTVLDFLNEVKDIALKGFENQDYQYEDLVEQLYIKRDAGRNPLFDTMLVLQNTGSQKLNIPGLKLVPYEYENKISKFDLTLIVVEIDEKLRLTFEYSIALFSEATIQQYAIYFNNIMCGMLESPQAKISVLEIITAEEKKQVLYDFNITGKEYPQDKTIQQVFEEQLLKSPDRISIFGHGQTRTNTDKNVEMLRNVETLRAASLQIQITYRQLNEQADHLAGLLIAKGVLPDTIVGIMMERSIGQISGLLGILKSGGAYMSIDPDYPPDRIAYMLKDSKAKVLIINKSEIRNSKFETNSNDQIINDQNKNFEIPIVLNFENFNLNSLKGSPRRGVSCFDIRASNLFSSNLAYIIFTSGSTGRPKGVLVTHQNVVRLVKNTNYIEFIPGESILQIGAVEFDASTFEIWGALLNGLKLILATKETILNPGKLKSSIRAFNINTILMVSSLFNRMVQSDIEIFAGLKYLLVGGDVLSPAHIQKLRYSNPQIQIINGYGPTENTTFSTTFLIQKEYSRNIPIGKPIANSTVYIIDKYNHLQPIGLPGELIVGGDGIARGYLNNPELTAKNFILPSATRNPFEKGFLDFPKLLSNHSPIYKTGDLARWLSDGNIEFLGRIDQQIKIRGFRVELGEIENQLMSYPGIKETVVSVWEEKEDKYLCAYLVSDRDYEEAGLREFLPRKLPAYMIPSYFITLKKIPLTTNCKIDYSALPKPGLKNGANYTAPANEIEKKLVELWHGVLNRASSPENRIGIDDNFFELGGHSLNAVALISLIHKELNVKIPLSTFLKNPSIRDLALNITNMTEDIHTAIESLEKKEFYAASAAQKRLYFINRMFPEDINYNINHFFIVTGKPGKEKIQEIFRQLIARHEAFRTTLQLKDDHDVVQSIKNRVDFSVAYFQGDENNFVKIIDRFIRPFDFGLAPFLRVGWVDIGANKDLLMIDMHHIISDLVSANILTAEFLQLFEGKELLPLHVQYKDYAAWESQFFESAAYKKQKKYWLDSLSGQLPSLNLPTDFPRPAKTGFKGKSINLSLPDELVQDTKDLMSRYETTPYMTLAAFFVILLAKYSGQTNIIIGSPSAGRSHADLENIIGFFVNMLPMRFTIDPAQSFTEFLPGIKRQVIQAFENRMFQFDELIRSLDIKREEGRNPLYDVVFSVLNSETPKIEANTGIQFQNFDYDNETTQSDLRLGIGVTDHAFLLRFTYALQLFKTETAEQMLNSYIDIMKQVFMNNHIKIGDISITHVTAPTKSNAREKEITFNF